MPLDEFLRILGRKHGSDDHTAFHHDFTSRAADDLAELVWENGQITVQGQSSRVSKSPFIDSITHRVGGDGVNGHLSNAKVGKFVGVESLFDDITPEVPSGELDDMAPWFYPFEIDFGGSQILPEVSSITQNSFQQSHGQVASSTGVSDISNQMMGAVFGNQDQSLDVFNDSSRNGPRKGVSNSPKLMNFSHFSKLCAPSSLYSPADVHPCVSSKGKGSALGGNNNNSVECMLSEKFRNKPEIQASVSSSVDKAVAAVKGKCLAASGKSLECLVSSERFNNESEMALRNPTDIMHPVSSSMEKVEVKGKGSAECRPFEGFHLTEKGIDPCLSSIPETVADSGQPLLLWDIERDENLQKQTAIKNGKLQILMSSTDTVKKIPDSEPNIACSSVGSGHSVDVVSCKRKVIDFEESVSRSDDINSVDVKSVTPVGGGGPGNGNGTKRSRAAEVHNLSERRRRDRINEKMRALQELIPNCNKADKASMLDEAIEYLKMLQLQVQIMSMGAGLCMPPVMFPPGMQPMYPPHLTPFPVGMGFGVGMPDTRSPFFPPHFAPPASGPPNFMRVPGSSIPVYGQPVAGTPCNLPLNLQPPVIPPVGGQPCPSTDPGTSKGSQLVSPAEAATSVCHKSHQAAATGARDQPPQAADAVCSAVVTSSKATGADKQPGSG